MYTIIMRAAVDPGEVQRRLDRVFDILIETTAPGAILADEPGAAADQANRKATGDLILCQPPM